MVAVIKDAGIDIQAIILAGGRGTRIKHPAQQKCLLQVDGAPILEHILLGLKRSFGRRVTVIIATGFRGQDVQTYFGYAFEGLRLSYVSDHRPLETKGRLLLAKEHLVKPFLFLAGDVLTPDFVLERIVTRFEEEQSRQKRNLLGILSGATDHSPALTHAVLRVRDGYLANILHPPPEHFHDGELREAHRAIYSVEFLQLVMRSREKLLSRVIGEIIQETTSHFGVEGFDGAWAHYATPEDLIKYQDLPFLREIVQ